MVSISERGLSISKGELVIPEYKGFNLSKFNNGDRKAYLLDYLIKIGIAGQEHSDFIHKDPLPHEGSQALYFADYYIHREEMDKIDRVLVSWIQPNSMSSRHYHEDPLVEDYHPLAGQLYLNEEPIPPEGIRVKPYTIHRASTKETEAVTLIIMKNAGRFPEDRQHIRLR